MLCRFLNAILFGLLLLAVVQSRAQTVALSAPRLRPQVLIGGVSVTVTPATLNFTLVRGGVSAPQSLTITTTVGGLGVADTLVVTAYLASSGALTTAAGDIIPSSLVLGSCSTCLSAGYTAFAQSTSFAAASSLQLLNATTLLSVLGGSRTDTLNLEVDLTNSPQTPAGSYTGTLVLAAQIF